jgi:hypothetical protein
LNLSLCKIDTEELANQQTHIILLYKCCKYLHYAQTERKVSKYIVTLISLQITNLMLYHLANLPIAVNDGVEPPLE